MASSEKFQLWQYAIARKDNDHVITLNIEDSDIEDMFAIFTCERAANRIMFKNNLDKYCHVIKIKLIISERK